MSLIPMDEEDWKPTPDLQVIQEMFTRAKVNFQVFKVRGSKEAREPYGTLLEVDPGCRHTAELRFDPEGFLLSVEGGGF